MAAYLTSLAGFKDGNVEHGFFDTLRSCLRMICTEGALQRVHLAPPLDPPKAGDEHGFHRGNGDCHERDVLLLRDGVPLLAVFMRYQFSRGPLYLPGASAPSISENGYLEAPSYAGAAELPTVGAPTASVDALRDRLADRLRAAVPPKTPAEPPKPSYAEGSWVVIIRVPGKPDPFIFQGVPMDVLTLDLAFSRLVDLIVERVDAITAASKESPKPNAPPT